MVPSCIHTSSYSLLFHLCTLHTISYTESYLFLYVSVTLHMLPPLSEMPFFSLSFMKTFQKASKV